MTWFASSDFWSIRTVVLNFFLLKENKRFSLVHEFLKVRTDWSGTCAPLTNETPNRKTKNDRGIQLRKIRGAYVGEMVNWSMWFWGMKTKENDFTHMHGLEQDSEPQWRKSEWRGRRISIRSELYSVWGIDWLITIHMHTNHGISKSLSYGNKRGCIHLTCPNKLSTSSWHVEWAVPCRLNPFNFLPNVLCAVTYLTRPIY